jgi:hypothetical protein
MSLSVVDSVEEVYRVPIKKPVATVSHAAGAIELQAWSMKDVEAQLDDDDHIPAAMMTGDFYDIVRKAQEVATSSTPSAVRQV